MIPESKMKENTVNTVMGGSKDSFCSPFCAYSNFSEPRTKVDDLWPGNYF